MTSERKIEANRANARVSTGPKTARGRMNAARNALRHALSLPVSSDPGLSEEVEALARDIVRTDANAEIQELARRIAEAHIDLRRTRHARHQLLSQALDDPDYESQARQDKKLAMSIRFLRRFRHIQADTAKRDGFSRFEVGGAVQVRGHPSREDSSAVGT